MATTTEAPENGVYSSKEFDTENGTRVFNIDKLKTAMGSLQGLFDNFANELKTANDLVTSDVNASCEHCVFGDHGMFMLNLWVENASTFHDFNANFTKWSQAIAVIANKNANFTNVVEGIYNNRGFSDNGLSISATYNGKDYTSASDMRADIIVENAMESTDVNGKTTRAYFDDKGNYIVEVTDKDRKLISLEKTYYDKDNNLVVEKYDADGKTITEKTTTEFDEFGRALIVTSIVGGVSTTTSNEYDSNGRLLKTETVDAYGNVKSSTTNTYDDNGNLVKTETLDGNGQVTYSQETKYDDFGLVESVTTVDNGTMTTISNKYDGNGNVTEVKTVVTDDSGNVKSTTTDTYEYTTETETDAEGNVVSTTTTTTVTSVDGDGNSLGTTTTETKVSGDTTTTTVTKTDSSGASSSVQTETTKTESGTTQKVTTTDGSGNVTSVETKRGEDGSVTEVVTTDKDGNTSTVTHNEDGTTTTTYRDEEEKEIPAEEKPDSFNDDGSLRDDSEQQETQPTTEAPSETPETEAPSEAPVTEAPSETPVTEAPSEVPETEAPSEAPVTEAPSEVPETEATTEATTSENGVAPTSSFASKSGDLVKINGEKTYSVYGHIQKPDGEVVTMYSDPSTNKLYYVDDNGSLQPVMATHINGQGTTTSVHADINSVDETVSISVHGTSMNQQVSLKVGDVTVASSSDISATATLSGNSVDNGVEYSGTSTGADYGLGGSNLVADNKVTMYSAQSGQIVYDKVIGVPTSMQSLVELANNGADVIRIDPQYKVQWDSPSGGYGYTFSNEKNPVFLVKSADGSGYQIADEYGNVINSRIFTMDGFNNNGGVSGGVWKNR